MLQVVSNSAHTLGINAMRVTTPAIEERSRRCS